MQIYFKIVDVPIEAKLVPLRQKRKKGRPSKAKRALVSMNEVDKVENEKKNCLKCIPNCMSFNVSQGTPLLAV